MEILITNTDFSTEDTLVDFQTPYGLGKAYWNGTKNYKPQVGKKYKVEYDIEDTLIWGKDVVLSKKSEYLLLLDEEAIKITGKLKGIDKDGIAILEFGESVIQLEIEGKKLPIGKFIDVITGYLEIFEVAY